MPKSGPSLNAMASRGESINHYNAVRIRLTGSGDLNMIMYSLDDVASTVLESLTMTTATSKEPTRLMNFKSQRAALKLYTSEIDEYFQINRIIIFMKPVENDFPM